MRQLGTSYRTAWLIHHELMVAMARCDSEQLLSGTVQIDDAYLGGERPGVGGRGSPNKVPTVAAVQTYDEGHPLRVKLSPVSSFSREAIADWARRSLLPGTDVRTDGLARSFAEIDAGCAHFFVVAGVR